MSEPTLIFLVVFYSGYGTQYKVRISSLLGMVFYTKNDSLLSVSF